MKRLTLAIALLALAPAPALAQHERLAMQYTEAGDPELRVDPFYGQAAPEVRRCPPGGAACVALPAPDAGLVYLPGETAPGTVFEADLKNADRVVVTTRTVPWKGTVTATSPPSLSGDARVGGTVTAGDGTWSGGWGDRPGWRPEYPIREATYTKVIACRTPEHTECRFLPDGPLAQRWGGWYLFAASTRSDGDYTGRPIAGSAPWPSSSWDAPDLRTRAYSAPVQVCCTLPAPPVTREVTLRKKALRGDGKISVGRVTCSEPCYVTLRVSGGNRKATVTRLTAKGLHALKAPARKGKLLVRVYLDGDLVKTGRVSA